MTSERKSLMQRYKEWGNEKSTWKEYSILGLVVAAAIGVVGSVLYNRNQQNADAKAPYEFIEHRGQCNGYRVRIDEDKRGRNIQKRVHLSAVAKDAVPYNVSGHDYNNDGVWDRFFIQTTSRDGCNSAIFNKDGTWKYEPCPADKDKVAKFTEEEITRARKLLDDSVRNVYLDPYLVRKNDKGDRVTTAEEQAKKMEIANKVEEKKPELIAGPKLDVPAEPKIVTKSKDNYQPSLQPQLVQRNCDVVMSNSLTANAPLERRSLTTISPKVSKLEITLFYPTRELRFRKNLQMPIEAFLGQVNPHALTVDNYAQFSSGADNVPTAVGVFKKKSDEKGLLKQDDANWFYFQHDSEIPVRIFTYEMERVEGEK